MIFLLVQGAQAHTHDTLVGAGTYDLRISDYRRALRARRLERATYLFGDLDRLDDWELELAARLYRRLGEAGMRVLNDPARVRQRGGLLRALRARGLNDFSAWRVEDGDWPDRYPVFLRREAGHGGPISDLLHDETEARRAVEAALADGVPSRALLLVEYRGEPVREALFRKLGMYRVGERLVPALCAHETTWVAKVGQLGIAGEELYRDEYEMIRTDRHVADLRPAFELAEVEYGRADFGIAGGRVQVWEINTNPHLGPRAPHPFPIREAARDLAFGRLVEAFEAIDTAGGGAIRIDDEILARQRRYDRWPLRPPWRP